MFLKLIFVLKSKPTEDQGTPPGRQKWKRGACWLKGSNKQLRPYSLQTAQEITSWKDALFFNYYFICFSSVWSSSATLCPQLAVTAHLMSTWMDSCSAPTLRQSVPSQLVCLKLLLKMVCSKPASCRKGSSHAALPPQPSMSSVWEGHILSCHSCCMGKAMFADRINSNNDGPSSL